MLHLHLHLHRHAALPTIVCLVACIAGGQRAEAVVSDLEVNNLTVDASALFKGAMPTTVTATQVGIGAGHVLIGNNGANSLAVGPLSSIDNRTNTAASIQGSLATWAQSDAVYADMFAADFNFFNNNSSPTWAGAGVRYYGKNYPGNWPGSTLPLAKLALFTGNNVANTALGPNGIGPIYLLNGSGVGVTVNANLSTSFLGTTAAVAGVGQVNIGGGLISANNLDIRTSFQGTDGIVTDTPTGGFLRIMPNVAASNYNALAQAGDAVIAYSKGLIESGTLVIGPHSASPKGLRIDASGKVGIGGTPFDTLDVNGGATIRGPLVSYSPSAAVYNATNAYTAFGVIAGGTFSLPAIGGSFTTNVNQVEVRSTTNHPLVFMTNNVERMRIDTSGNVGVSAFTGAGAARFNVGLSAGQSSLGTFMMTSDNGWIQFLGNSNNQAYNPLVQPGDKALIYTNGPVDTGRLVIGPWSSVSSPKGIVIDVAGNVGIGMTPTNKLTVAGTISAKEIKVTTSGADYVFEDGYPLRSLDEVARFVAAEKHLPEMMPAKAMQDEGMSVSEVVTKQLAKIEELTLYAIQQQKVIDAQQAAQTEQQKFIATLQSGLAEQQRLLAALTAKVESGHWGK
jgi:hypothetical protein